MTREEAAQRYGAIVGDQWPNEMQWCKSIIIPEPFCWNVSNSLSKRTWTRIYLNKDLEAPLLAALENLKKAKIWSELLTFDGCYNVRNVRGSQDRISSHSYALALDFNAATNPLGQPSALSHAFVKCFKDAGFYWGGDFTRCDPMHFGLVNW